MLTRWYSVNSKTREQSVTFKYTRKEEFLEFRSSASERLKKLVKELGEDHPDVKYRNYHQGRLDNLKGDSFTDLSDMKMLTALYYSFIRAADAMAGAAEAFEDVKSGTFSLKASTLLKKIMSAYFPGVSSTSKIQTIQDIFQKTSQGLNSPRITISDCAGREVTLGGFAEGVVPLKMATAQAQLVDLKVLDKQFAERASELTKKYNGTKLSDKINQLNYGIKPIEEAFLMHKYLANGQTGSIHIEFSYAKQYSRDAMARIIAHEATHKFGATADFGYADKDQIANLPAEQSILNADSYAYAAMSVLRKDLITPASFKGERPAYDVNDEEIFIAPKEKD